DATINAMALTEADMSVLLERARLYGSGNLGLDGQVGFSGKVEGRARSVEAPSISASLVTFAGDVAINGPLQNPAITTRDFTATLDQLTAPDTARLTKPLVLTVAAHRSEGGQGG
ncbi:MAG: hypothetical protein ACKVGZ_05340, partial [Alphaproteobacteria bacterium]